MNSGIKSILGIGIILAILAAAFWYYQKNINQVEMPGDLNQEAPGNKTIEPPVASANPDAAVDAIIQGLGAEADFVSAEDNDSSLISADSQAINNFGQSYDEKEF